MSRFIYVRKPIYAMVQIHLYTPSPLALDVYPTGYLRLYAARAPGFAALVSVAEIHLLYRAITHAILLVSILNWLAE